jgi:hypothetical protein
MVNYHIPPLGFCVTCLVAYNRDQTAITLFKGTSLCADHLKIVLAKEVEDAVEHEDGPEEPESRGTTSWTPPTDPESDIVRRTAY